MNPSSSPEYVLGTGADELGRLGLQHQLWSDAAHSLWRRAGLQPGMRILDVGCGPGYASFDLAQLATDSGRVVGVDESASFIEWLNDQSRSRRLPQLRGVVGDVHDLAGAIASAPATGNPGPASNKSAEGPFDAAYARWVLCFVKDPGAVVRSVASVLKPGGRFCVHDYFNYRSMSMAPRRASHDKAVAATIKSWEGRGGDTDVMARVPRLMEAAGLRVTHLHVHARVCRGSDTMFAWPYVWWHVYAPKLVEMGLLGAADRDELFRDLDEVRGSKTDFIQCPPVYEVIGVKA